MSLSVSVEYSVFVNTDENQLLRTSVFSLSSPTVWSFFFSKATPEQWLSGRVLDSRRRGLFSVTYVVGIHWNCLEVITMCTYNICLFNK